MTDRAIRDGFLLPRYQISRLPRPVLLDAAIERLYDLNVGTTPVAADRITEERIDHLTETHSFAVLLHATHRLMADVLRRLTTMHPGECIVILAKHPESRFRQSLRGLQGDINPNVSDALTTASTPAG